MFGKANENWLIVGLGNPGKEYEHTRHNAGFRALDLLAENLNCKVDKLKFQGLYGQVNYGGRQVFLLKPQTFMNLSGEAVGEAARFYKIPSEKVIVISDDVSLDVGKMRIRKMGSAGGHNGLESIIACCGGDDLPRINIGIGKKPEGWDLADWVLGKYSEEDLKTLQGMYENSFEAAKLMVSGKLDEAMNKFN